jgi:hypothetical protein
MTIWIRSIYIHLYAIFALKQAVHETEFICFHIESVFPASSRVRCSLSNLLVTIHAPMVSIVDNQVNYHLDAFRRR